MPTSVENYLFDIETAGPLEAAAESYADDPDTRITIDRTVDDTWLFYGRECPKMRLKLTLDLRCLDDSPDDIDNALIIALRDFCIRAKGRLGGKRGQRAACSCSDCKPAVVSQPAIEVLGAEVGR